MKRASRKDATASSPHARPARDGRLVALDIAALPVPLIREHVFSFLTAPPLLSAERIDADQVLGALAPLRVVSRQWKQIADSITTQTKNFAYTVVVTSWDQDERRRLDQEAQRVGANVRYLRIEMGHTIQPDASPWVFVPYEGTRGISIPPTEWSALLSKFQHVVRLDLSLVPFTLVGDILAAAVTSCRQVRALILPFSPRLDERSQDGYGTNETDALVESLRNWYHYHGGLRLLHVPYWPVYHHSQLLDAIVRYCPGIWYLRGWHSGSQTHEVTALFTADRYLWSAFCHECTELREFNWRLASMWGTNVDAFCQQRKPFLEELVIDETRGRANIDYAIQSVRAILRATPQLRRLRLQLQDRMFFVIAENHAAYADLTTTLADAFVADVIAQCPKPEQFHYRM